MKTILMFIMIMILPVNALAGGGDDPLLTKVMINQMEYQDTGSNTPLVWDAEGWIGKDINKLWLKTDGEYTSGKVSDMELQALYSRAVSPFWDFQTGWRRDIRPTPNRNWLAIGFKGLAPYFIDIDTAIFIGDNGRTAARLQIEYELLFTQRLILTPEIEFNIYGKDDPETATGSGLANIETSLRLRYEIRREFAPYIGLTWNRLHGQSADYARAEGDGVDNIHILAGIQAWF